MVDQLTTLDTSFLHAEDADPHTNLGIGGLAILDGPIPDHRSLISTLGERIGACPRFAQRLRRHVFDVSAPEWVDDIDFDLANHVRRIALPGAGTDDDLFRVVADVMSWRLDRDRPLWEIWVIDGLSDGRWAMLVKVHPCIADGIATVHILTGLSDNPDMTDGAVAVTGGASPPRLVPDFPGVAAGAVAGILGAGRVLRGSAEFAAGLLGPASPLNGPVSSRRRYSTARVGMADVSKVCRAFDVTVNDVALTALTESYRTMLARRGEQPGPDSLRTLVPVSGASHQGQQEMLLPRLPVDEDNPVLRLRMVHARLAKAKADARHGAGSAAAAVATVSAMARLIPFPLTSWALSLLARLPQHNVATLAIDVPGPRQPLQVMGCDVVQVLPIPPIAMRLRTAVATLSYADQLFFGILADYDAVPDADELARGVETAVARLVKRSKRRGPTRDRHGLSLVVNA